VSRVVVTGASGQLGTAFRLLLPGAVFVERAEFDLADRCGMREPLTALNPDIVINCAAYTAVDAAEADETTATRVNGTAVAEIADYCAANDARLVTYSTDYVFDGKRPISQPWVESDSTDPVNEYGRSKRVGEQAALGAGALVIRTSWVVSETHPNFVATMLRLVADRELSVVNDQHGCPTIASDLASATLAALDVGANGLLHLTNQGATTWFELARAAVEYAGFDPDRITPCATSDYPTPAPRPANSVLASERLHEIGLDPLPSWKDSLPGVVAGLYANGVVSRP